jgi:MarR family transcriptional regulator, 2-MHQ and catechol-resistance regulon repressor
VCNPVGQSQRYLLHDLPVAPLTWGGVDTISVLFILVLRYMPATSSATARRPAPPESVSAKLFVVMSRAATAVGRHTEVDVAAHGFTTLEWAILDALYYKGPLLLGELQKKILASSGGITYLVDRLAERGLVERRECAHDRRARYAALTPEGEKVVRQLMPGHLRAIEKAMSGLTQSEQRECTRLLKKLGKSAAESLGDSG